MISVYLLLDFPEPSRGIKSKNVKGKKAKNAGAVAALIIGVMPLEIAETGLCDAGSRL